MGLNRSNQPNLTGFNLDGIKIKVANAPKRKKISRELVSQNDRKMPLANWQSM